MKRKLIILTTIMMMATPAMAEERDVCKGSLIGRTSNPVIDVLLLLPFNIVGAVAISPVCAIKHFAEDS